MHIAINQITGILYTEDKTPYSAFEASLLKSVDYQIPPEIHLLKRVFGGTILSVFEEKSTLSESNDDSEESGNFAPVENFPEI